MSKFVGNIIICSLLALGIYMFIYYSETSSLPNIAEQWVGMVVAISLINIAGFVLSILNLRYNKWLPWNKHISLRFFIELLSGIILSIITASIFIFSYVYFKYPSGEIEFLDFIKDGLIKFGILTIVIIYCYSIINFSIELYFFRQNRLAHINFLSFLNW